MEKSRKIDLHDVGIWTVERSSPDSSVAVPMKLKERQTQESFSSQLMRLCCRAARGEQWQEIEQDHTRYYDIRDYKTDTELHKLSNVFSGIYQFLQITAKMTVLGDSKGLKIISFELGHDMLSPW